MKPPIYLSDIIDLFQFAQKLALALADEAMYVESLYRDGYDPPTDNTLQLLSEARTKLELEETFDNLDSLKPLLEKVQ